MLTQCRGTKTNTMILLLDWAKAFDKVRQEAMHVASVKSGIDPKFHEELIKVRKAGKKGNIQRKKELINQAREHGVAAIMLHKDLWR